MWDRMTTGIDTIWQPVAYILNKAVTLTLGLFLFYLELADEYLLRCRWRFFCLEVVQVLRYDLFHDHPGDDND